MTIEINPLPGLLTASQLFSDMHFRYPRPDLANPWNQFLEVYSNNDVMTSLEYLAGKVKFWASEKAATSAQPPIMIGLLNGCAPLYLWLAEKVAQPGKFDLSLVKASTYDASNAAKEPKIVGALPDVLGRDVLLVDDMGDSFRTERLLKQTLRQLGALPVASCNFLIRRPGDAGYRPEFFARELAKEHSKLADEWLIGMGLDGHNDPATRVVCDNNSRFVIRICPKQLPSFLGGSIDPAAYNQHFLAC